MKEWVIIPLSSGLISSGCRERPISTAGTLRRRQMSKMLSSNRRLDKRR
jgi:hypothetical protein